MKWISTCSVQFSSVQFSPLTNWVFRGTWWMTQQRFFSAGGPCKQFWHRQGCPLFDDINPAVFSADHITHPPRSPEGWFWRCCHDVWHAWSMQISISWQLPGEVPVDLQRSWSCYTPNHWSSAQSRRYGEVASCTWFCKPGSFLSESARRVHVSQP